jgi:23S rRNA (pseudouridine1915-N3)-methyltransferase
VGTRMPEWVQTAVSEYSKRLPRDFRVDWVEIPPAKRQGDNREKFRAQESIAIKKQLKDDETLVALDVQGSLVKTEDMAKSFTVSRQEGTPMAILIGGPDGIDGDLLRRADARWSLGRITLPHPLVRVVLAEQLYRAWSINARHPYHRA